MPIIRNFGLFWKAEDVYWGEVGAGNAGQVAGFRSGNAGQIVNFSRQVGIYILYADYQLVYVGQTGEGNVRLRTRLGQHRRDHLAGRWNQFSWFGLRPVLDGPGQDGDGLGQLNQNIGDGPRGILNHIEAVLIYSAEPPLNRQGGPFGGDADQYLQFRDPELLGPTQEEMLRDIWQRLGEQ